MSLYVGKDNTGVNILHLTNGTVQESAMKASSPIQQSVFHSRGMLTEVVASYYFTAPTSWNVSTVFPAGLTNYINSATYGVFFFVRDAYTGTYVELGLTGYAVYNDGIYLARTASFNSSNSTFTPSDRFLGQTCFAIVCTSSYLPTGTISISNNGIFIGGISITSKNYLIFNSYTSSTTVASYYNGNMNIVGTPVSSTVVLDNKSIKYGNDLVFKDGIQSRCFLGYNGWATGSASGSSLQISFSGIDSSSPRSVSVIIPISVFWEVYGNGAQQTATYNTLFTFQLSASSSTIQQGKFPYTVHYYVWDSSSKLLTLNFGEQTSEVGYSYIGPSSFSARVAAL